MTNPRDALIRSVLDDIQSDRVKKVIIDTDAGCEIDDQFAILYALCARDKMDVLSINAAPVGVVEDFEKNMLMVYDEINRVIGKLRGAENIPVYHGGRVPMEVLGDIVHSPAADNIVKTVMESDERIYVLGLGGATNIASALLIEPKIADKICVIWLGTDYLFRDEMREFNLSQDYTAGQVVLNSGCPLVLCTDYAVAALESNLDELTQLAGVNPHGTYLAEIAREYHGYDGYPVPWKRTIWDFAAPAILALPKSATLEIMPTPLLTDDRRAAIDKTRHKMIMLMKLDRDMIYKDSFDRMRKGR